MTIRANPGLIGRAMSMSAGFLERAGDAAERLVKRYMPDPFVLVLLLTLVTLGLAMGLTPRAPLDLLADWQAGFSELLAFAMQMVLIVVTGEAIVAAPGPRRLLLRAASLPRTPAGAVGGVAAIALALGWVHWGFGLIAAAILAREVGAAARRRGIAIHYPLLGAAGYMSMLLWHAGTTASAPLIINTTKEKGNFVYDLIGIVPLSETVFTPENLAVCAILLVLVPLVLARMTPRGPAEEIPLELAGATGLSATLAEDAPPATPAERLDRARWPGLVIAAGGLAALGGYFHGHGLDLNHNVVNFLLLMVGLLLHRSPVRYARAVADSLRGTGGIVIQFPFYGGIMGLMRGSGLGHMIAAQFVALASAHTLPFFAYCASIVTKLFIPSGGGEWAVEGPVMLEAAKTLGASIGRTTMGIAYGNMVGNMFQPFWAIPLLAILGLRARDIMGYCLVVFLVALPLLGAALLISF